MPNETIIVIDPGHGGTEGDADNGASYDGITERHINMTTAKAMYDELSSYEGVTVYLTHDSADIKMSLKERAEFAKSVNADYLISIHYNASEEHIFYGSEVFIASSGEDYVKGYQLGSIILDEFEQLGLANKGVKTRVNDYGTDYYGIIRESRALGMNSLIIEHCYLDHGNDLSFRDEEADYIQFGIMDATSVAKFLGLKNEKTGMDYSDYTKIEVPFPETVRSQDLTPPSQCDIQLIKEPSESGTFDLQINAFDSESELLYYCYSLDGGVTFSDLFLWESSTNENRVQITCSDPSILEAELIVKVYNQYHLDTPSNPLIVSFPAKEKEEVISSQVVPSTTKDSLFSDSGDTIYYLALLFFSFLLIFLIFLKKSLKNNSKKK